MPLILIDTSTASLPQAVTAPVDYFGIMAEWEEFKVLIDELFIEVIEVQVMFMNPFQD